MNKFTHFHVSLFFVRFRHSQKHKFLVSGDFMERKLKLIFGFMTHSSRVWCSPAFAHDTFMMPFPVEFFCGISDCGLSRPPEKKASLHDSYVCSLLVLLPFIFMLTFPFLSLALCTLRLMFATEGSRKIVRRIMSNDALHSFRQERFSQLQTMMCAASDVSFSILRTQHFVRYKNYVCMIKHMHKIYRPFRLFASIFPPTAITLLLIEANTIQSEWFICFALSPTDMFEIFIAASEMFVCVTTRLWNANSIYLSPKTN